MYKNSGLGMRIILTQINQISPNLQGYSCLRPEAGILSKFGSFACNWKCDACGIATFVTAYRDASSQNTMNMSSIGAGLASMTSRRQIQDGGPHDFRSKMAAPMTSGPRWRPPRHQDGGPTKSDTRWRPL